MTPDRWADIERLEQEVVFYWRQSFEVTEQMTISRLGELYEAALRREKKNVPESKETEEERNRRVMLEAVQEQKAQIEQRRSKKTRYMKVE